jgi:hypothetical protein
MGGAAALVLGTGAWYLLTIAAAAGGWAAVHYAVPVAAAWGAVALGAGALFGFAGAVWRDGNLVSRGASVALLGGALAGEALLLMQQWTGRAADLVLSLEFAAGVAIVLLARRRIPLGIALGLLALVTVGFSHTEGAVRDALRLAGWGGP